MVESEPVENPKKGKKSRKCGHLWLHVAIGNAKSLIRDMYHDVSEEFLQLYPNEFCYKLNRVCFVDKTFDELFIATVRYRSEFKHRLYKPSPACG